MRRRLQISFDELVKENRQQILEDDHAMTAIEEKIEQKHEERPLDKA